MSDRKPSSQKMALYEMQAEICGALASPIRLQILDIIGNSEKTGAQLLEVLEIPKANLSQHMAVLKDAGILNSRKEGLFQYWSLAIPKIRDACAVVKDILAVRVSSEEKRHAKLKQELRSGR